jgi:hypothetical protein
MVRRSAGMARDRVEVPTDGLKDWPERKRREDAGMGKVVDRPYVVSVALSHEELSWLRELAQIERVTEERVLRRALGRFRKRVLKRRGLRKEVDMARVEIAG